MTQSTLPKPPEASLSHGLASGFGAALFRLVRRVVVFVLGISVLAAGIVMIVGPGPAIVFVPLGLAILATEFLWARRIMTAARRYIDDPRAIDELWFCPHRVREAAKWWLLRNEATFPPEGGQKDRSTPVGPDPGRHSGS